MSNETLILKTAVATNSTVKLTDCPMSAGEILEMVCRLYANGLTSGNRCFKAIGNAVTYNTDAVTEGDIYCVSYRDEGFYVGLRTTEDYEPKEGDWWCYVQFKSLNKLTSSINNRVYTQIQSFNYIYNPFLFCVYFNGKIGVATTLQGADAVADFTKDTSVYNCDNVTTDGLFLSATPKANQNYMMQARESGPIDIKVEINKTPTFLMFHKLTASDILAYKVTGHMGYLMVGDASVTHPRNDTSKFIFGSDAYPTFNNTWDFNTKYLLIVTDENGDIYNLQQVSSINFYVRLPNTSTQVASCSINVDYINGCLVTTETLAEKLDEEYLDTASYNYINGYNNITYIPDSYTVYKIPILQDNRPATLNALNTNLLNSNQTDVQPINDETDG